MADSPPSLETPCEQNRPRKVRYGYEKLAVVAYALAREILRCAQDDTNKASSARVILSESFCSEESRRTLRRPAASRGLSAGAGRSRRVPSGARVRVCAR